MDPTDSVTEMDYLNPDVLFVDGGIWCPRWVAVDVRSEDDGQVFATPRNFDLESEPWSVRIVHCECGQEYAERDRFRFDPGGRPLVRRCRRCENTRRAERQRAHRAWCRRRELATACAVCGTPIRAERRTRRYCSPACRQRAHRQSRKETAA